MNSTQDELEPLAAPNGSAPQGVATPSVESANGAGGGVGGVSQLARRLVRCVVLRLDRKSRKLRSDRRIQVLRVPWPECVKGNDRRHKLSYEITERETFVTIERIGSISGAEGTDTEFIERRALAILRSDEVWLAKDVARELERIARILRARSLISSGGGGGIVSPDAATKPKGQNDPKLSDCEAGRGSCRGEGAKAAGKEQLP